MTNNERNFDILMKLAVDKCMEDEIAEFDALDTSDITVPEKTRRKVMNTLRMKYLRESLGVQIMKRITVACLAIVTVLFAAAMSIQPIRAAFWEAVVTWYEDYIAIRMEKDPEVDYPKVIEERILPENLPEAGGLKFFPKIRREECTICMVRMMNILCTSKLLSQMQYPGLIIRIV